MRPDSRPLPIDLERPGPTAFHRLNPLTKLILATVTAVGAVVVGGVIGPLTLVLVAVVLPALYARELRRLARTSLLVSLPIGLSALLVNVFFFPGGHDVIAQLGPIAATREGLDFAVQILARIAAISGAITLFYLTTRPADLVLDLERRGVSGRVAFVANASVQTVPRMVELAASIVDAQRARGLDTQGAITSRLRGIVPIVGPVILGSIADVEERTMALEARGFTRQGRRTLLWAPADTSTERIARWLLVLAIPAFVVARTLGVLA